jgi:hypothetical protein
MEKSENILNRVSTILSRVNGEILADLYARHSFSAGRSVKYRERLTQAIQLLEKLELLAASRIKPDKD